MSSLCLRATLWLTVLNFFPLLSVAGSNEALVIGHRGASGYRPEHTLPAYDLAIDQKADFIEPDLVITKDGVLIARHENEISGTTDVEKKFPERKTTKTIDGNKVTGWFTEDFTLSEIKSLRAKERLEFRSHEYDFKFPVPTLEEILELVAKRNRRSSRKTGVYIEMKHPTYFASINRPLEAALAEILRKHGLSKASSHVIVQSFELRSLQNLQKLLPVRLVFLFDEPLKIPYDHVVANDSRSYGDLTRPPALKELAKIVYGIGPYKRYIVPADKDGKLGPPTTLVADAHAVGLKVHPYTFRSDGDFLAKEYGGDPGKEYAQFFSLGVDGLFTDFPDHAVRARNEQKKKEVSK